MFNWTARRCSKCRDKIYLLPRTGVKVTRGGEEMEFHAYLTRIECVNGCKDPVGDGYPDGRPAVVTNPSGTPR